MPSRLLLLVLCTSFASSVEVFGGLELPGPLGTKAVLQYIPAETGAACLDGSKYGIYYFPSSTGSKNWTIFFQGGGWCYNESLCYDRSSTVIGSSKDWPSSRYCNCLNLDAQGKVASDCNCIYIPYCDGASFSGYRKDPWPVPGKNASLVFRGLSNLDATIDWAIERLGMNTSAEVVVSGSSAGGLSTFLHMDRVAKKVYSKAKTCKRVVGAPYIGYFLDHSNGKHSSSNYTAWMKYIYHMQNLTSEATGGALKAQCLSDNPERPYYCFMSPHMQKYIKVPFFVFNSKFDAWQLINELQEPIKTSALNDIIAYGQDFLKQFKIVTTEKKNGAFITSCICHGCPWDKMELDGRLAYENYELWMLGKEMNHFHIDTRGPNGDGALEPICTRLKQSPNINLQRSIMEQLLRV